MNKIWQENKLGNLCTKITDGSHFSPEEQTEGYPMFSVKDMRENSFDYSQVKLISEQDYSKLVKSSCKPLKDDILIAKDGSYLKHIFVCKEEKEEVVLSSIAILRPNKEIIFPDFLSYTLKSQYVKDSTANYVSGSALPRIILEDFKKVKIPVPPLPIQRRIASILGNYDLLIANYEQQISTLEQTAREIYKEWFVRGRCPYSSNWEEKTLGEICTVARGSSPRPIADETYFKDGTIPWIKIADATASGKFLYKTKEYVNEYGASFSRLLPKGSLIIATSGTLGFSTILGVEGCIHDGWIYFTNYKKGVTANFMYFVINSLTEYLNNMSYGAAIQNINTEILREVKLKIPNIKVFDEFNKLIYPIDTKIDNLSTQISTLQQTRDKLLPRLLSGVLAV